MRTWPEDWDDRRRGVGCIACAEGRPDEVPPGRRIFAGRVADAYLSRDLAVRGYTLVFWRGRHVADVTELTEEEMTAFTLELRRVARAIEAVYRPDKLNLLTLGNTLPHLHTHIVPRYIDDPDPGVPPRFMMVDRAWPLIPADRYEREVTTLRETVEQLD